MSQVQQLLTEHLDICTAAETEKKSGRGRASGSASKVYGIQKLRGLILDLAVRGKLVPQDANDEPASELLKRIQAEKTKLIADGKLKKEKSLAPIAEDEKLFELPIGWEWIRIGLLGNWGAGTTPLRSVSSYYGGTMPWFKSGELVADYIDTSEETVSELALQECSLRLNQPGDVLLAMYGATIGKASILKVAGTTNQAVCACTPNGSIFNRYLLLMLKAMKDNFVGQGAGGAQPNISREKIIATLTALPPHAEQQRIVAKVDELMALCDHLEQQHSNAAEAHEKLVEHLLGTLTQAQNAQEFNSQWQRIFAHFDMLFTTEASIDALKQTLLQLAVMGKLVPQDPNDEPASELLKRIQAEKTKLIAEGKLKKEKPFAPITDNEKPFELPKGWQWARLNEFVLSIISGGTPSKNKPEYWNGNIPWASVKDLNVEKYLEKTEDYITAEGLVAGSKLSNKGDLIICTRMGLGKIAIAAMDVAINQDLKSLKLTSFLNVNYFIKFYSTLKIAGSGMTVAGIRQEELLGYCVPLPPLSEQQRIVTKVDELMALCDQLKIRIQQASQQQQQLADVLVAEAVA